MDTIKTIFYVELPINFDGECVATGISIPITLEQLESEEKFSQYIKTYINEMLDLYVIDEMFENISFMVKDD
jgi:hypothetical protein